MVKRNETNQLTKECIRIALLRLMKETPYDEISITEITRLAGVSRMAYYRNYSSKDEILIDGLVTYEQTLLDSLGDNRAGSLREVIARLANLYAENATLIRAIHRAGLSHRLFLLLCDRIYRYVPIVRTVHGGEYTVYYYAGAILSVLRCWVDGEMTETTEQITEIISRLIGREDALDYIVPPGETETA